MLQKDTVTGWLEGLGVGWEPVEPDDPEAFHWAIQLEGKPFRTLVAQTAVGFNYVQMQVAIRVSDNHRELLRELPDDDRDRFMHDLRIQLLQMPVGMELALGDSEPPLLELMSFQYNLFEDPVQLGGFLRRHHQLQSTGLLAIEMVKKLNRFKSWPG